MTSPLKPEYVLYHANCDDGFGAAWVIHGLFPDIEFKPVQYGSSPPKLPAGSRVAIVDFSYPRAVLLEWLDHLGASVILDHHKTAEADIGDLPFATFDMERSGAMMAWDYWHPDEAPPLLVQYVQDRDLWRLELPDTEAFTADLRSYPRTFKVWDWYDQNLYEQGLVYVVRDGKAIRRRIDQQVEAACANAVWTDVGGHRVLAVNETHNFSEVAGELAKRPDSCFGAAYFTRADGKRQWSLRSVGDFDVSEVAKGLGGGGHRNAAGFTE